MSDFLKKFLLEDPRRFSPSGRFAALAAFGKHPGWDDHVEDLGLETESLNFAKIVLYVNGIGGQIDAGAWEKLDPAQQLPGFKHLFVWQRSGQILLGRLWSSSDGKGRKRYPMVVCLHFMGVTLGWALKQALPHLAELEQGCTSTTSAADVRSLLARKRAALREALQATDTKGEYAPVTPDGLHHILSPAAQTKPEGFLRVLYQIQSQFAGFAPGALNLRTSSGSVRVQQIRVPMAADTPEQALLFWTRFFLVYVDASVPLLLTMPLDADWLDITAGEPESHEMFCLRANPKAVPKVSEVPYTLDTEFTTKASAFLAGFQRGETARPDLQTAAPAVSSVPHARKGGWLKWLGVGVVLLLGAVAAVLFLQQGANQPPPAGSSATKARVPSAATNAVGATPTAATPGAANAVTSEKARLEAEAEAARLADEKKKADAVAAAARLKAETEAAAKERERQLADAAAKEKERQQAEAAAKERLRQAAEAARLEAEKQAALQKEMEERQRQAAALAASQQAQAASQPPPKTEPTAAPAAAESKPPAATPSVPGAVPGEMTNSVGMVLVRLPSGTSAIWVGKYEVTQFEYKRVMNTNPSHTNWLNDLQPVQQVTWNDAVEFTHRLTELEKGTLPGGMSYSLPTEKQWTEFSGGQKIEDLPGGSLTRKGPSPVGKSGPPNKFGLFDVLGNVWEWCLDDEPGDQKLLKGGAFNSNNYNRNLPPDSKSLACGFRCVLSPVDSR